MFTASIYLYEAAERRRYAKHYGFSERIFGTMSLFEDDRARLDDELERVVSDVRPDELRSYVGRELSKASLTPALLCLLSARATGGTPDAREAAGIQFVHAGLDATRRVLDDEDAWTDAGVEPAEEDMVLLAADVLVSVGFGNLLDHYEAATRVVNTFGSSRARALEATTAEERFEHESAQYVETYKTAVEIGCDGDAPEDLLALAESLAVADFLGASSQKEAESRRERTERALSVVESGEDRGYDEHIAAIRVESAAGGAEAETGRSKGVEAQD